MAMPTTMAGSQERIDDLIYLVNFPALSKQAQDLVNMQKAANVKVTYIQAGQLWFATLCICSAALLAVFTYGLLFHFILYKKRWRYEFVVFKQNMVRIIGMNSGENEEENETEIKEQYIAPRVFVERILPISSCLGYLVSMIILCIHSMIYVLHFYEDKLHTRLFFSIIQICCSCLTWFTSTFTVFLYRKSSRSYPVDSVNLSRTGKFLLYQLQCESVWSLHAITSVLLFDDILVLLAVISHHQGPQEKISLTELLYIWQALFVIYIIVFFLLDVWLNNEIVIFSYILMVIVLCEIPARNYKLMSQDPACLGTSLIGLLILGCLTARIVLGCAGCFSKSLPHFKSD